MKKILALLLAGILALSLCACNGSEAGSTTTEITEAASAFQVGFAEVNIVPDFDIGLQGFGNNADRVFTGSLKTYIYAHILAMTDANDTTALVISVDAGSIGDLEAAVRKQIEQEYKIPQDNVIVHAIHQHSTPGFDSKYSNFVTDLVVEGVGDALNDRAPAEMYTNVVQATAMSFVRNYITNDGTIYGPNYGDKSSGLKEHESEADNEMRLVKFVREGDKTPVVLVNFQGHPHLGVTNIKDASIHGDWPEIMRSTVKEELGYNVMYISGAGGNMDSKSEITEENVSVDWKDHGKRAAGYVMGAESSYVKAEATEIKSLMVTDDYTADHSMDHLLDIALIINEKFSQSLAAGQEEAKKYYPEIHNVYHANNIIKKAALDATIDVTIGAIAIGDVVFTAQPYEVFDTNGVELRQGTVGNPNYAAEDQLENPYKMTVVCSLANGHLGYVPSQLGYTNGGYSTDITKLAPGSGELLVGDLLHILQELHG